jgi:hypothetical protein
MPSSVAVFKTLPACRGAPRPSIRVRIGAHDRWPRKREVRGGIRRIIDLD